MPSSAAWRARSALVQWVMCRPLAIGSRHASATTCACWRGGKARRGAAAGPFDQQLFQADALVPAGDPPDGGAVALHPPGDALDALAGGQGQDDPGAFDLKPRQAAAGG